MSTRILLVDDHNILREGLKTLLQKNTSVDVVGEADNGRTAVTMARDLKPDLVIMDVAMQDLNGIDAARQILGTGASCKVLALSMHSDGRFVTSMLEAGASGYLLKDCASSELTRAIDTVMGGDVYLSPGVTSTLVRSYLKHLRGGGTRPKSVLTPREREVLQLIAEGKSTKEVAEHLFISVKTVETHRKQIMDKLEIRNLAELTKYAIKIGLTSLDT